MRAFVVVALGLNEEAVLGERVGLRHVEAGLEHFEVVLVVVQRIVQLVLIERGVVELVHRVILIICVAVQVLGLLEGQAPGLSCLQLVARANLHFLGLSPDFKSKVAIFVIYSFKEFALEVLSRHLVCQARLNYFFGFARSGIHCAELASGHLGFCRLLRA